ncbi:MAG: SprT family zinc-dependent metalloprotease [Thermoleophilaceae bacterium]
MSEASFRMIDVPYSVRRSDRARHARIVVDQGGVEVVVPRRMALRHVEPFVRRKQPWIERTLRRLREAERTVAGVALEDGGSVPYLGTRLDLRVRTDPHRVRAHVARRGETLHVSVASPAVDVVAQVIEGWYRRRARVEVARRLDRATARAGSRYTRLSIRGQRTRWASCSSTGAMSFNWRLLLAPEEILDYVVEHEVAHLEVLDHSRRFWSLLERRCPSYREHERWLRRNGPGLRLAGGGPP